jgi:predicted nucleic acid-binding protein
MAVLYLDTSALAKRYIFETGSAWVQSLTDPAAANNIWIARITGPEIASALFLRVRIRSLTRFAAAHGAYQFRADELSKYFIAEVTAQIASHAMTLVERHGLRGFDAVHVAAALAVDRPYRARREPGIVFISADTRQLQAARGEGLSVDDPNLHP